MPITFLIPVKQVECLRDLFPTLIQPHSRSGQPEVLVKVNSPRVVAVQLSQYLIDELAVPLETHLLECLHQLARVDRPRFVLVEDVE